MWHRCTNLQIGETAQHIQEYVEAYAKRTHTQRVPNIITVGFRTTFCLLTFAVESAALQQQEASALLKGPSSAKAVVRKVVDSASLSDLLKSDVQIGG